VSLIRSLLLAFALIVGLAAGASAQIREGYYEVLGTNPDGSQYQGGFALQAGPSASWIVTWQVGNEQVQGLGLIQAGVMAVSFVVNGRPGVSIFEVMADGKLRATWTTGGGVGTEIMTPR
jgi:hypothetical protein